MYASPMARPLILVSCWRRELPTYLNDRTRLETLDPAYAERVSAAGGQPLLLSRPPSAGDRSAPELVDLADGGVLSGGGDGDPAAYGAPRENVADVDAEADQFELEIIRAARAAQLPTLGICGGIYMLAVAHDGALMQRPPALDGHTELTGLSPDAILRARR